MDSAAHFRKGKHYFSPPSSYTAEEDVDPHCHKICIHIGHVLKFVKENIFTLYYIIICINKSTILRQNAGKVECIINLGTSLKFSIITSMDRTPHAKNSQCGN